MFDFPASPSIGQDYVTPVGISYTWNGYGWNVRPADPSGSVGDFVLKTGDTMSGNLVITTIGTGGLRINSPAPFMVLNKTVAAANNAFYGLTANAYRWEVDLGNDLAETGANIGSNFAIKRYSDAGALIGTVMEINRANGLTTVRGDIVINKAGPALSLDSVGVQPMNVVSKVNGLVRWVLALGDGGAETGANAGSNFALYRYNDAGALGGAVLFFNRASGAMVASGAVQLLSTLSVAAHIDCGGTYTGIHAVLSGSLTAYTGSGSFAEVNVKANGGNANIYLKDGGGNNRWVIWADIPSDNLLFTSPFGGAYNYMRPNGQLWLSGDGFKPGGGAWSDSSDQRIKDVKGDYVVGLDAINNLHPVRYTFLGNDTAGPPIASAESAKSPATEKTEAQARAEVIPQVPYLNSTHRQAAIAGTEFIGLIAQEAEIAMPELVNQRSAYINGQAVTDLRDLNTGPLVFALINAVKELSARIVALEAAAAPKQS